MYKYIYVCMCVCACVCECVCVCVCVCVFVSVCQFIGRSDQRVLCMFVCACDIKFELSKTCHLYQTFIKPDALLHHEIHSKVLSLLWYQDSTRLGP